MVTEYIRSEISPNLILIANLPFQSYLFHSSLTSTACRSIDCLLSSRRLSFKENHRFSYERYYANRHSRVPEAERGADFPWITTSLSSPRITLLC
jgi:hypothetical protein